MALTKIKLNTMVTGTLPDANIPDDITIDTAAAAPANALTGNTLASGVTASSLTSVGTLTGLTTSGTVTVGASNGSTEVKVNRSRMRHIDGLADASDYSHGDLYINHISTGNIYMQRNTTFAQGVAINGASLGSHKLVVDNGTTSLNRGNSSGDILDVRGLNTSQFKVRTQDTTAYNTLSVEHGTTPQLILKDTGGSTNKKIFRISGGGNAIYFEGRNDNNDGAGAVGGDGSILNFSLTNGNTTFSGGTTTFPVGGILRFGERGNLTHNSSNYNMTFNTNSASDTITITGDGRVAIRAASLPQNFGSERGQLAISSVDNAGANNYAVLQLQGHSVANNVATGGIYFYDHSNNTATIQVQRNTSTSTGNMLFYTNGGSGVSERMRIKSNGNVGIGSSDPNQLLTVNAADGVADNTYVGYIGNQEATDGRSYGLRIVAGSTVNDAPLFIQDHDGANDLMIVRGNGRMGIGTTAPNAKLHIKETVSGQELIYLNHSVTGANQTYIQFRHDGTQRGNIQVNDSNDQIVYNTTYSDKRLKQDFEEWDESILPAFKSLKPQLFNFKNSENKSGKTKGYIAQDNVEKFPEAYTTSKVLDDDNTEYYSFNPSGMVAYLMKAVKELTEKVETLENA